MLRKTPAILLILLLAFGLRVYDLTGVPPGLTHDEANHGREAISILDGELRFYFPLNYGSEPAYSYFVAGSMAAVGENAFALRLVGALFGVLTVAAVYAWSRRPFGRGVGLLAAGLLSVSYWPLVASRMALRATLLPFFTLAAVWFFWQILRAPKAQTGPLPRIPLPGVIGFGTGVAITLHVYLAARVVWLVFPLFVGYLALVERQTFKRVWLPTLAGLLLAGALVTPMFVYLENHPEAETRLQMLDGTLQETVSGNLKPLLDNTGRALLAFFWPGAGDQFLAYNIPGRPVFGVITSALFVVGLVTCLYRWKQPPYAFVIFWLGLGILPSLITGPTANTTRNIGALPVIYVLPAVGCVTLWFLAVRALHSSQTPTPPFLKAGPVLLATLLLALVALTTVRDYFGRWANDPDVRAAYQTTIMAALEYAETHFPADTAAVVSSVYPGAAHDSSIALIARDANNHQALRWVDARRGLIFPAAGRTSPLVVPASTPLHPYFESLAEPIETVPLRPDDLDPHFTAYELHKPAPDSVGAAVNANFNGGITLVAARWLEERVSPGGVAELLTLWRVTDPAKVGPLVPPAYTTEAVMFTHVLRPEGTILTQHDALDAPSWSWQAGDLVLQIHQMHVPPETAAGEYPAIAGLYDRTSGRRLPVLGQDGTAVDTHAAVPPLTVRPERRPET